MRVIAGEYKGRRLLTFKGQQLRPLTDRIKASLFDCLRERLEASSILDLFSGSGGFGIEALSRGADFILFVEKYKPATELILKNLHAINCDSDKYRILRKDALNYLKSSHESQQQFDIIFADPPFKYEHFESLIDAAASYKYLREKGLFIIRYPDKINPDIKERGTLKQVNFKKYGDSLIKFFIKSGE